MSQKPAIKASQRPRGPWLLRQFESPLGEEASAGRPGPADRPADVPLRRQILPARWNHAPRHVCACRYSGSSDRSKHSRRKLSWVAGRWQRPQRGSSRPHAVRDCRLLGRCVCVQGAPLCGQLLCPLYLDLWDLLGPHGPYPPRPGRTQPSSRKGGRTGVATCGGGRACGSRELTPLGRPEGCKGETRPSGGQGGPVALTGCATARP